MRTPSLVIAITALAFAGCIPQEANFAPTVPIDGGPDAEVPDADPNAPDAEPETPTIGVDPGTLQIIEGQTQPFRIKLSHQPTAQVVVALEAPTGVTLEAATVSFDPATEDALVGKTIDVTVVDDDNTVDEDLQINLTAPGHNPASLRVLVEDRDEVGINASQTTFSMTEGRQSFILVALTAQPPDTVTVTPVVDVANAAYLTVGSAMIFTPKNWNMPQELQVVALEDADAFVRPNVPFTLNASDPEIDDVIVRVTINDNDTQGIELSDTSLTIAERTRRSFTVRPRQQPPGNVTFTLSDPTGVTLDRTSVEFTPQNYQTARTIEVLAEGDENLDDSSVTIAISATPSDNFPTAQVVINITDPDEQSIVETAPAQINLVEEGAPVTFTVRPRFQASGNVTINVGVTNGGIQVTTSNQLNFTPQNYTTPQNVTLSGRGDPDLADVSGEVVLTMGDVETRISTAVDDNDTQALNTSVEATNTILIPEGMSSGTRFQVWLEFQPGSATTVNIASDNPAIVSVHPDDRAPVFDGSNYATPRTVRLIAGTDPDEVDASTTIRVSSTAVTGTTVITANVDDTTIRDTVGDVAEVGSPITVSMPALGQPIMITRTMCLDRLQLSTTASTGQAKMGLFTDVADKPGAFIVGTSAFNLRARTSQDPFSGGVISPTEVAPGRYWVGMMLSAASPMVSSRTASRRCRQQGDPSFDDRVQFGTNPTCANDFSINLSVSGTVGACSP